MGMALLSFSGRLVQPLGSYNGKDTRLAYFRPHRRETTQRTYQIHAQADPENLRVPQQPPKTGTLAPSLWLSREDAVEAQLKALQHNNFPTADAGIEIMYRFADIDPWSRSTYFGRSLDLGQWERFRRVFNTKCFTTLLNHSEHHFISSLEVSEDVWKVGIDTCNIPDCIFKRFQLMGVQKSEFFLAFWV